MSMPIWPLGPVTPPEGLTLPAAIASILYSVAVGELALSHVINAEGEKIQYFLGTLETIDGVPVPARPETVGQILMANESVRDTLMSVLTIESLLSAKMAVALDAYYKNTDAETDPVPPPEP